jgi:ABC-type bacteriocin/lantibiotic exporter with double-glycine peptidase domain
MAPRAGGELMRRILSLLRPYGRYLAQALLVSLMLTMLALPGPYITKLLLDDAYPHRDYGLLHFLLLGGAGFGLFLTTVQAGSGFFGRQLGLAMSLDVQSRLLRHVQSQDLSFFDRYETGDVLSRFDDLEASVSGLIHVGSTLVINSLQLLVFPAVLLWIDPVLALLSLAVLPFDALLALLAGHYSRRYAQRIAEGSARLSARTVEALGGMRTIQSLGAEGLFYRRIRSCFEEVAVLQVQATGLDSAIGFTATTLRIAGALAYGWVGWTRVLDGDLTPGTFLAFSAYAGFLYGPVKEIITLWPQVQSVRVHMDRFLEIYDRQPLVRSPRRAVVPGSLRGDVTFDDVCFDYGGPAVLADVSVRFPAGCCTALIGRSGAGKSTLVKLIPRFYDPTRGTVCVDGQDVRTYDLPALRRCVGFAVQGGALFQGTIRENLDLGQELPTTDIEAAARAACIHEHIAGLAKGYDTSLGEGGAGFSAGQLQRLALARVLLLDTPILILDEPTSALDTETEAAIRDALREGRRGRTTILIAHRPETIAMADDVVELVDGAVQRREASVVPALAA